MTRCLHVLVSGKVQQVGFRAATRREALRLGVTGHARNLADGQVEVVMSGEEEAVTALAQWLRRGPALARVDRLRVDPLPTQRFDDFVIRQQPSASPMTVAFVLFDQIEPMDLAGPFEVFSTAARLHRRAHPAAPALFELITVAEQPGRVVRSRGDLLLMPSHGLDQHPAIDLLLLPGGDIDALLDRTTLIDWIATTAQGAQITATVCTGAFLAAQAGLLAGRRVTTHWEDCAELAARFGDLQVVEGVRYLDEGKVVTSAGVAAGIDMALHLLTRLRSLHLALDTARQMAHRWRPANEQD